MQMLVFRDRAGRTTHTSAELLRALREALRSGDALDGLLRAGEIECSLADLGLDSAFAAVTDALAYALIRPAEKFTHFQEAERRLAAAGPFPSTMQVRAPEGFAYYALHPLSYALPRKSPGERAAVVGIRSIGTTLSAVTSAALHAPRITVRPGGHPYNRITEWSPTQCEWILHERDSGAEFFVVDEGPGLSGSSLLSTGEALVTAGVPPERIVFVCSRLVDPRTLLAEDGARRWSVFRTLVVDPYRCAPADAVDFSQADWRNECFASNSKWPAVWTHMTGPKLRSADGRLIFKFEGFGKYGDSVRRRSELTANAGFGPVVLATGNGWSAYERLPGSPLSASDLDDILIERIAEYSAFRQESFAVETADCEALEEMSRFNSEQLWQQSLNRFALEVVRPVIADGRMMPYEWRQDGGRVWKVDAAAHGDNHFFPGPVDVAWDLAGAMVEWQMGDDQRAALLNRYKKRSGDDASSRIDAYITAYCAFQAGYAKMAAAAMQGSDEAPRFLRDLERYRQHLTPRSAVA
jgi:hypothetical protein